ncbi:hypothetical protein DNTS_026200 [Danionella cerebrum]|uniref:Uncharacterized protein n=1 Tax=Danionella cerebrum TaxID=2873325 RepID=A0A553R0F7_9TELE|nr:hypothetical protein DNTS_026200 [Danionella translucida]
MISRSLFPAMPSYFIKHHRGLVSKKPQQKEVICALVLVVICQTASGSACFRVCFIQESRSAIVSCFVLLRVLHWDVLLMYAELLRRILALFLEQQHVKYSKYCMYRT